MNQFGLDIVSGRVIGDIESTGQLFYQGRPQGPQLHAENEPALRVLAMREKYRHLNQCGKVAHLIFPADAWELRVND